MPSKANNGLFEERWFDFYPFLLLLGKGDPAIQSVGMSQSIFVGLFRALFRCWVKKIQEYMALAECLVSLFCVSNIMSGYDGGLLVACLLNVPATY